MGSHTTKLLVSIIMVQMHTRNDVKFLVIVAAYPDDIRICHGLSDEQQFCSPIQNLLVLVKRAALDAPFIQVEHACDNEEFKRFSDWYIYI